MIKQLHDTVYTYHYKEWKKSKRKVNEPKYKKTNICKTSYSSINPCLQLILSVMRKNDLKGIPSTSYIPKSSVSFKNNCWCKTNLPFIIWYK